MPDAQTASSTSAGAGADTLREAWYALRQRLVARGLMARPTDSLSLRDPASGRMWWGTEADALTQALPLALVATGPGTGDRGDAADADSAPVADAASPAVALHRAVYAARADVCTVLVGGGDYGRLLSGFGGWMPPVFDEQIRQLGHMAPPTDERARLATALARGGNVAQHAGQLVLLGMTPARLALNAELFEKCAKAWVPAVAGGARVRTLPWLVRHVANGRLMKEQARARARVRQGLLPEETRGY